MLTQENRSLKLQLNNFNTNSLLPIEVTLQEAISQPFSAQIHCLSQQQLDGKKFLGQQATLILGANELKPRYVNGIISAVKCGINQDSILYRYQLTLVPIFDILKKFQNCQFFTSMSVPDIFKSYCKSLGYINYDLRGLQKSYPELPYKTQFNETAFDFLSRLLQETDIYYYFTHNENQHQMILCDRQPQFPETGILADFFNTKNNLFTWQDRQSLLRSEQKNYIKASGNYVDFSAGYTFQVAEKSENRNTYLITAITHHAKDYTYVPEVINKKVTTLSESQTYLNQFECIDINKYQYCQQAKRLKPKIPNLQIAVVAAAKDYSQDVYTDALGRVQLRFPWDRQQKLSNWVNVSQSISDNAFGSQFIPRIGQEVLVSYIDGDSDKPIVIGAVPNANNKPAYDLEKKTNLSWIKSNTLNSSNPDAANQIVFDDTAAQENLQFIAQRNYLEEVKNNSTYTIKGDDIVHVKGADLLQVLNGKINAEGKSIRLCGAGSEIVIDAKRVTIHGSSGSNGRVNLYSREAGVTKAVARVGDFHQCPKQTANVAHYGGPIINGSNAITANNQKIARMGDSAACRIDTDTINQGISSVLVNGKPIARLNHSLSHGGVITSGSPNVYVGEKPPVPDIYQMLHIKPEHILVIHLCDFYNVTDPNNKQPTMNQSIQGLSARAIALLNDGTQRPWPLSSVINGKLYLPGQQPADINTMTLCIEPGAVYQNQQVNIIAINNQPIPASDTIVLKGKDFTKMEHYEDKGKNICYPMTITLLQPALFFNFRQDNWLNDLTLEEKQAYDAVKPYYANPQAWFNQYDSLTDDEINYFKKNGNNATIYIHGFNVSTGNFAKGFTWNDQLTAFSKNPLLVKSDYDSTLYRDENSLPANMKETFLKYAPTVSEQIACLVGTGAHRWLVCMEHNLNQAAGMPANDYRNYTRLIFVNWQGDPIQAYDYMAATCLTQFPARKIFNLIQQLNQADIKINIMAHSLGSDVLMRVLDLCGTENIMLDRAFLWEAAIPNTALQPTARWYFPMINKYQPEIMNPLMPYSYNFTHAAQGAKGITVLYSALDNILGAMPDDVNRVEAAGKTASEIGKELLRQTVTDAIVMLGAQTAASMRQGTIPRACDWIGLTKPYPGPVAEAEKFSLSSQRHLAVLAAKIYDPAAGLQYAIIADLIDILDHYFIPLAQTHKQSLSIYHLANMFVMPFSYLLTNIKNCEEFFQLWRNAYSYFQLTQNSMTTNHCFSNNLSEQIQVLVNAYPKAYQFINGCVKDINQLKAGQVPSWLSEEEQMANNKIANMTNNAGASVISSFVGFLLGKAEQHENVELSEAIEKYTNNPLAGFLVSYPNHITTVILMVLLTPEAVPADAMGWKGIETNHQYLNAECYHGVNQNTLLPDHSGMLFPNDELYQKIYVQHLLGGKQGEQFNYFGLYKPA